MADPTPVPVRAPAPDTALELLRHAVATLAYRAGKVLRDVPDGFAEVRAAPASRSAMEILSHMVDLMGWAERLARGGGGLDATAWVIVAQVNALVTGGVALAWLGANEAPAPTVLLGGSVVIGALLINEWLAWRGRRV